MGISSKRDQSIDYAPCRYNGSRLWFRGPYNDLRSPYVACLGGSGIYGRYVTQPWSALLEAQIGCRVVNLGVENAGIDAYLNDAGALSTAANAKIAIIQLACVHNTSNRYYLTHPRRNDRFLKASASLQTLYPEMDFTEVHFTRHMLTRLNAICPTRFETVANEACAAWLARMGGLISQMNGVVYLLWFAPMPLPDDPEINLGCEPFLARAMVNSLTPKAKALIEVVPNTWRGIDEFRHVPPLEMGRAEQLPGPLAHAQVADAVACAIGPALQKKRRANSSAPSNNQGSAFSQAFQSVPAQHRTSRRPARNRQPGRSVLLRLC
ncbi:DUF6473 family protein [Marivita sp.]|uniref:DUF6473 family protein n=1 Tax=Marivita sp. TaxID=2003365 RepID=UPI003F6C27DF